MVCILNLIIIIIYELKTFHLFSLIHFLRVKKNVNTNRELEGRCILWIVRSSISFNFDNGGLEQPWMQHSKAFICYMLDALASSPWTWETSTTSSKCPTGLPMYQTDCFLFQWKVSSAPNNKRQGKLLHSMWFLTKN